ncbi:MAG TPA: hypothetical protein VLH58_02305, partial [Candidatus Methylomirabilis sp.]|nr:hypothetical protein [Candidatus Methylomirabilis sp.]
MRVRSNLSLLSAAAVLVCSLVLYGCPKRPEVIQASPAAVGPAAARVAPSPPPAPEPPRVVEAPVPPPPPAPA